MAHSLVQTLGGVPEFSPLDEHTLLVIVGESMNLFWRAGSVIFEPGTPGDALYVVLTGEVVILEGGTEVSHLLPGDSFGEMSLLLNTTHSRKAMAVGDSELLVLPKEAFLAILRTNERLAEHFDSIVHTRLPAPRVDVTRLA
ncbi:MAG TPA: cyclic nucleotide-binding domain-containing protein [Actinomycetota bacterium]|nr:cyclic nucleotide-binding domain-containing protein [Actinomycetota bacterium]